MASNREWNGDKVAELVRQATERGMQSVVADCIKDAKENVPVQTGNLQRSIRADPPDTNRDGVSITWGSFDVNYALAVETGNRSLIGPQEGADPLPVTKSPGKNHGNTHFLRGATDKFYPELGDRIKKELGG